MNTWDEDIDERRVFFEGLALFNAGDWFEAHDVWEDVWNLASGDRKSFYQGLIMCAYVMEHVRRGNPRGVKTSYASLAFKFKDLPRVYRGIDVMGLQEEVLGYIKPVLGLPRGRFVAGLGRGQEMPVSLDDAPKIAMIYDPFEDED